MDVNSQSGAKRLLFMVSTEGKSPEQMKADAREALRKVQQPIPDTASAHDSPPFGSR